MADISDVENTLRDTVGGILMPGGVAVLSYATKTYRGYPVATILDPDLANQISHVVINEAAGFSRLIPGYLGQAVDTFGVTTLTVGTVANVVTFGGTANANQLAGIKVNGVAYSIACVANDTPSTVASKLAALSAVVPTVNGAALTFPNGTRLDARVGSVGQEQTLPRYQTSGIRISIYAFSPAARDAIASLIDAQLSYAFRFITLPDGQSSRLCWRNTHSDDMPEKEQSFRRDILYTVDYSTSITVNAPQMLWGVTDITPQSGTGANLVSTAIEFDS